MMALFERIGEIGVLVFIVSSMLFMGLGHNLRELIKPLRNVRGVLAALVANFVVVPAVTLLLLHYASFGASAKIGLFLFASSAGAAFLIKYIEIVEGNLALCVSLLLVLMPATVIYLPLVVPLLLPEATVSAGAIGMPLLWTMIVPLGVGLLVGYLWPVVASQLGPWMARLSTVSLVALVLALFISNVSAMGEILGTGVLFVAILITLVGFGAGYVVGGKDSSARRVVAFGTGQRNIAAAMVVASQALNDKFALLVVVASGLVGILVLLVLAFGLRRRTEKQRARGEAGRPMIYQEV